MTRPLSLSKLCPPEVWADLGNMDRAALSRLCWELHQRSVAARKYAAGSMARMDADEAVEAFIAGLVVALRRSAGGEE